MKESDRISRVSLVTSLVLFGSIYGQGAELLSVERSSSVLKSLVAFCIAPPRQDEVFTCAVEEVSKPNPGLFQQFVFDGIDKRDKASLPLIQARSNVFSQFLTGRRFRLIREFASECVYTAFQNELIGDNPIAALGSYQIGWETNYTICQLYDAKGSLGFKRAQATPQVLSVITEAEGPPIMPQSFHYLYRLEPQLVFFILSNLNQTNAIHRKVCNPLWEDFSTVISSVNVDGISSALRETKVKAFQAGDPDTFELQFVLGETILHLHYEPKARIPIPLVEVRSMKGELERTITRTLVSGNGWFAEWYQRFTQPVTEGPQVTKVYYFRSEITDAKSELEHFSANYIKNARQATHKDAIGKYTESLQGKTWRQYNKDQQLWISPRARIGIRSLIFAGFVLVFGLVTPLAIFRRMRRKNMVSKQE